MWIEQLDGSLDPRAAASAGLTFRFTASTLPPKREELLSFIPGHSRTLSLSSNCSLLFAAVPAQKGRGVPDACYVEKAVEVEG